MLHLQIVENLSINFSYLTLSNSTLTLINETLINATLINETLINATLINETLINETLRNATVNSKCLLLGFNRVARGKGLTFGQVSLPLSF